MLLLSPKAISLSSFWKVLVRFLSNNTIGEKVISSNGISWYFFVIGALFRGKGGPPVLDKPARRLPRQGRGVC